MLMISTCWLKISKISLQLVPLLTLKKTVKLLGNVITISPTPNVEKKTVNLLGNIITISSTPQYYFCYKYMYDFNDFRGASTNSQQCPWIPSRVMIAGQSEQVHALRLCNAYWNSQVWSYYHEEVIAVTLLFNFSF